MTAILARNSLWQAYDSQIMAELLIDGLEQQPWSDSYIMHQLARFAAVEGNPEIPVGCLCTGQWSW